MVVHPKLVTIDRSSVASKSPIDEAQELQKLVVDYAKQETLDPLKSLGRYLGLGIAGAFLIFVGVSFAGIGVLRLIQSLDIFGSETPEVTEQPATWGTTVPYLAAILTLSLALLLIYRGLVRAKESVKS